MQQVNHNHAQGLLKADRVQGQLLHGDDDAFGSQCLRPSNMTEADIKCMFNRPSGMLSLELTALRHSFSPSNHYHGALDFSQQMPGWDDRT